MIKGIGISADGMMAQLQAQDITANNLANSNTTGFKRDIASYQSFSIQTPATPEIAAGSAQGIVLSSYSDTAPGLVQNTGDPLNLALSGDGFFAVKTASGVAYTRDGSFSVDSNGYLTTRNGDQVLGNNGPIQLARGPAEIDSQGRIYQNKTLMGSLNVVSFPAGASLSKIGSSLWQSSAAPVAAPSGTQVMQGYLEGSNVNTVKEMTSMITGLRTYEADQKAIQSQDETLDKLVNDVGRTA